jgi:hypothetical protein
LQEYLSDEDIDPAVREIATKRVQQSPRSKDHERSVTVDHSNGSGKAGLFCRRSDVFWVFPDWSKKLGARFFEGREIDRGVFFQSVLGVIHAGDGTRSTDDLSFPG